MSDSSTGTTRRLVLEPHASSAAAARLWIRHQLHVTGRDELVEAAELATSELVTNAILHAQTPVTISVDSCGGRCRIAVRDQSPATVSWARPEPGVVSSSGRGLQILVAITRSWGVDDAPPGKEIWFEPRPLGGAVPEPADPDPSRPLRAGVGLPRVQLCQAPVALLHDARQRHSELHREMLLLMFAVDDDETPTTAQPRGNDVRTRLRELAQAVESIPLDLFPTGLALLDQPGGRATLSCRFPDAGEEAAVTSWPDLLDEADDYCRAEHLLTLAAPHREAQARRWFLTEVARQLTGRQPLPWPDYLDAAS